MGLFGNLCLFQSVHKEKGHKKYGLKKMYVTSLSCNQLQFYPVYPNLVDEDQVEWKVSCLSHLYEDH